MQMLRQARTCVGIEIAKRMTRVAIAKVLTPASQIGIELAHQRGQRHMAVVCSGQLMHPCTCPLERFARYRDVQIPTWAPMQVAQIDKRIAQKVQGLSLVKAHNARLVAIELKSQARLEALFDPVFQPDTHVARQHHKVIGVAHQLGSGLACRPLQMVEAAIELMQIEVGQQRRDHPALRCARLRTPHCVGFTFPRFGLDHRGLQPHANELEHRSVDHPHAQTGHEPLVWDRVEVALQVRIVDRLVALLDVAADLRQCLVRVAPGSKPERTIFEVSLEDRLQNQQCGHLHQPIDHRWYPQRSHATIGLGDVHTQHRLSFVAVRAQPLVHLRQSGLDALSFQLPDAHPIDPRRASVCTHPLPCRCQYVFAVDAVIQRVEAKLRLLDCLTVELQSQRRDTLGQPAGQPIFRSGICIQAALSSSYRSMLALRPLRSALATRFLATMGLSDSRIRHACGYGFPHALGSLPATCTGLPGSSADLSTRAVPSHPGESDDCSHPLLLRRWQASGSLAPWPLPLCLTRPNRVRLRYGSRVRRTRLRRFDYSSGARLAICSMGNSQNELLSVHKINQAWPGAPEDTEKNDGGSAGRWASRFEAHACSHYSLDFLCALCVLCASVLGLVSAPTSLTSDSAAAPASPPAVPLPSPS